MDSSCVYREIRRCARAQLLSWETPATIVMLALTAGTATCVLPKAAGTGRLVSSVLLLLFAGITAFGLYETLPALVRFLDPGQAGFIRDRVGKEQAEDFVRSVEEESRLQREFDNPDMSATKSFLILHGIRNFEVIRRDGIRRIRKKVYPHRKKYKGMYFFDFLTEDGKTHSLELHVGKLRNPERSAREIAEFCEKSMQISISDR